MNWEDKGVLFQRRPRASVSPLSWRMGSYWGVLMSHGETGHTGIGLVWAGLGVVVFCSMAKGSIKIPIPPKNPQNLHLPVSPAHIFPLMACLWCWVWADAMSKCWKLQKLPPKCTVHPQLATCRNKKTRINLCIRKMGAQVPRCHSHGTVVSKTKQVSSENPNGSEVQSI